MGHISNGAHMYRIKRLPLTGAYAVVVYDAEGVHAIRGIYGTRNDAESAMLAMVGG